ncbi:MAG: metal ABC transporter, partial [Acidimicrobiia bacterium]
RVVGILLVAALMVLPVASGQLLARSFRQTLVVSSVLGLLAVAGGLVASRAWSIAPGGTIVLVAGAMFVAVSALGRRRRRLVAREGPALTSGS